MKKKHPMQPVVWDGAGVIRFQGNPIVRYLLDEASAKGIDLNHLARQSGFSRHDWEHFAQLIGYSVSGWGSLNYVSDEAYARAEEKCDALREKHPSDPKKDGPETRSPLQRVTQSEGVEREDK